MNYGKTPEMAVGKIREEIRNKFKIQVVYFVINHSC